MVTEADHWTEFFEEKPKMYPFGDCTKNTPGYTAIELQKYKPFEPCVNVF